MEVELRDFEGLDLRVGEIVKVEPVKGSDRLYKMEVDIGDVRGLRQTVAGLRPWYKPGELVGKKVIFLANLEEATIRGVKSQGMILAAQDEKGVALLTVDKETLTGARVK
jgi:methionine--tRNA ligase beta chain